MRKLTKLGLSVVVSLVAVGCGSAPDAAPSVEADARVEDQGADGSLRAVATVDGERVTVQIGALVDGVRELTIASPRATLVHWTRNPETYETKGQIVGHEFGS